MASKQQEQTKRYTAIAEAIYVLRQKLTHFNYFFSQFIQIGILGIKQINLLCVAN